MLPETTPDEIHDRSGHKARFLQDRDQTMKPKQFCIREAACLFPLSLILMCVVTPIVVPAQDDPAAATTAVEPAVEPGVEPGGGRASKPFFLLGVCVCVFFLRDFLKTKRGSFFNKQHL